MILSNSDSILTIIMISCCVLSVVFGIISILLSVSALISVKSLEKSTHNVEYIPVDPQWASSDNEINELNERHEAEFADPDVDELEPHQIDLKKLI